MDFDALTPADIHAMTYASHSLDRYPHLSADLVTQGYYPSDAPEGIWSVMLKRNPCAYSRLQVVPIKASGEGLTPAMASSMHPRMPAAWVQDAVKRRQREVGRYKWWQIFTPVRDRGIRIEYPRTHADTIEAMKDCQAWCDAQQAYEEAQQAKGRQSRYATHR